MEFLFSLRPANMKLGLRNITALLDSLGNPQERLPAALVAGTNGKGSVTTYLTSILRGAGYRTGTFYSPHLFRINERIKLNGEEIPSPVFDSILGELRERYKQTPFSFFEGVTAAAILYFVRENADIAVFEVGLGGRLDATRLVNAVITVITGISHDHGEHLGRTKSEILGEKLGITRKGVPLVANLKGGLMARKAMKHCEISGIPYVNSRSGISRRLRRMNAASIDFTLVTPKRDYGILSSSMIGRVQMENVTTAVRVAETLGMKFKGIGKRAISEGIGRAFFAGRFQVLPGNSRVILDVSHNEEALLSAADTLTRISPAERNVMIFGVMARKELGSFPSKALSSVREVILVPLKGAGSASGSDLFARFTGQMRGPGTGRKKKTGAADANGGTVITVARGMNDAVRKAQKSLGPEDTLLVLGSHLAVEESVGELGKILL